MVSMKETAVGAATILPMPVTPEPLFIDLVGVPPCEVTELVRAVMAECHDASIPLTVVRVPADVMEELEATEWEMVRSADTRIERSDDLHDRIEFWRRTPAGAA